MKKQRILSLCMASLALSLMACNGPTDEQNSAQPTASTQPTAAPTPMPPPIPYTDVAEDSTYYDAVVWAYKNGIATDGETFEPASPCTRGQVMTFLWRAMGSPEPQGTESPFNDVSSADWFYKPALWAYENGIATGTAFNPGNPCTDAEALTFLWRAEGKPATSVYDSAVALAASGQYYARPAAWAETNGLFAGADFDPAAPCSRADLMTYLYWANEQWTLSEEDKAVQAEYEQIIKNLPPYEVYDSGLFYADYIDVEGNGTVELLTVGIDWETNTATATVYANKNGCAEKLCEQAVGLAGTFDYLGLYQADGQLHFGISMAHRYVGEEHIFFKIENGAFVCKDHVRDEYDMDKDTTRYIGIHEQEISEDEYRATYQKYTKQKKLLDVGPAWYEFGERGILPTPSIEVNGAVAELSTKPYQSMRYGFMVPLRDTLEAMGVAVYANSDVSVILASTKKDTLVIAKGGALWEQGFEGINSPYYGGAKPINIP